MPNCSNIKIATVVFLSFVFTFSIGELFADRQHLFIEEECFIPRLWLIHGYPRNQFKAIITSTEDIRHKALVDIDCYYQFNMHCQDALTAHITGMAITCWQHIESGNLQLKNPSIANDMHPMIIVISFLGLIFSLLF